jgi:hypothetical protein
VAAREDEDAQREGAPADIGSSPMIGSPKSSTLFVDRRRPSSTFVDLRRRSRVSTSLAERHPFIAR